MGLVIETSTLSLQSGTYDNNNNVVKRSAVPRNRRDVVTLTPTNIQQFLRHLVPLAPLLKSLGGKFSLPDVSHILIHVYTCIWTL